MSNSLGIKMRIVHRYLGFFLAGIMAMYSLSRMVLVFRTTDTFKKEIPFEKNIGADLAQHKIGEALKIKGLSIEKEQDGILYFKNGTYNSKTGIANYTKKELPYILDKMTHLHKANTNEPLYFLNLFFGASLLFFIISSFWMFMPSTTVFKKGMYFTLGGIVLTLLLIFL
ncbi:MAG: hypothetical protein ACI9FN_003437 [Saprospiraceae bacterium]|jgi:hypothetical protein